MTKCVGLSTAQPYFVSIEFGGLFLDNSIKVISGDFLFMSNYIMKNVLVLFLTFFLGKKQEAKTKKKSMNPSFDSNHNFPFILSEMMVGIYLSILSKCLFLIFFFLE